MVDSSMNVVHHYLLHESLERHLAKNVFSSHLIARPNSCTNTETNPSGTV